MSNDLNTPPGKETRLLKVTERWATETERIAGYFRQTKELLDGLSRGQKNMVEHITGLTETCRSLSAQVLDLKRQCRDAQKRSGPMGVFDWAMRAAKEQPMAFSLVFITVVMSLILLTLLGYSLNLKTLLVG